MREVDFLERLNDAQRSAVQTTEGPLLIVAGPGSGKTRVITHRIAYLVRACGIDPSQIAAVTFTNKAAREMKGRLEGLLGIRARWLTCGTFHAFCASILRCEAQHIGLDRNFVIYDRDDQIKVLKRAMEEASIDPKNYSIRGVLSAISGAKSLLLDPDGYAPTVDGYPKEVVLRVYERYQSLLIQNRALDFDDLIMRAAHLLARFPDVLERYRSRYLHLLIDEFQDTNVAQYTLTTLLSSKYRNICVVGDPDQSIYSWRNADIRNILSFQREYPDAKTINLSENYRSTQTILETAKHIIAPNQSRLENELWTNNKWGHLVEVWEAFTEDAEAEMVIQEADRLVKEEDFHLGDCAVMYRTNAQSRALEEACISYRVPYRLIGGMPFYKRREIKDVIAYLRVLQNPCDEVSLRRIINVPARGIGLRTIEEVARWAQLSNLPLYTALQATADSGNSENMHLSLGPRAVSAVERFIRFMDNLIELTGTLGVADVISRVLEDSMYWEYLRKQFGAKSEQEENVLELCGQAIKVGDDDPLDGINTFLESVALVSDVDSLDEDRDSLTLITLHQAKGLEFRAVFIVGMEEGLLPHARSMDDSDPQQMEEERRLSYVGVTRAEQRLYLSRAFRRRGWGGSHSSEPSRFLEDIPEYLIAPSRGSRVPVWKYQHSQITMEAQPVPFKAGDKVGHPKFGRGMVVSCVSSGLDYEITVVFANAGVKRLLMSLAGLEKNE
ncbi:UvrD-helicase domain-containing protein [Dehalococcoidia bacterium]|nr:UvrD-helicase domain-containing protein [Dehalococcoidia bacterium]